MATDVPLWYIRERLVECIRRRQGDIDIATPLDEDDWPITVGDLVTEQGVTRSEESIRVRANDSAEVSGYEFRGRNSTGGDYADLDQYIEIEATLNVTEVGDGKTVIPEDDPGEISCFCEIDVSNQRSHSGEQPPF